MNIGEWFRQKYFKSRKLFRRTIGYSLHHILRRWLGVDSIGFELHETRQLLFKLEDYVYEHKNPKLHQLRQIVRITKDKRLNGK